MEDAANERVAALDLIRGVAVLGILAVNVAGFAGPAAATLSPHFPKPGGWIDEAAYAAVFVLFEGKMRALFSLLFGASMALFIERAEAAGRDGPALQARRLGWLLLFGYLHFLMLWWGDILFIYAVLGFAALAMRDMEPRPMARAALLFFLLWHGLGMVLTLPELAREDSVRLGTASPEQLRAWQEAGRYWAQDSAQHMAAILGSYPALLTSRIAAEWARPLGNAYNSLGETLPLMLLGMASYRGGFFTGGWSAAQLGRLALFGIAAGGLLTLVLLNWAWARHFPVQAMLDILLFWSAIPHLLMGLGYAALLVLALPRFAPTWLGRQLVRAGRMAFSNYLGTSFVMCAIFYGWGFGLAGRVGAAAQLPFVVLGWALMLAFSSAWLARFRQGPLEWAWRSVTEWRVQALRK